MFELLVRFTTRGGESKVEEERTLQTNTKEHSEVPRLHLRKIKFQSQIILPVPRQRKTTQCSRRSGPKWPKNETQVIRSKRVRHVPTKWNQMFPEGSQYQVV